LVAVLRKDGLDVPGEIDVDGTQPDSGHQSDAQRTPKPRNGSHGDHDDECGVLFNAGDGNLWPCLAKIAVSLKTKTGVTALAITPVF